MKKQILATLLCLVLASALYGLQNRPTPAVVGGATTAGVPSALLVEADGTLNTTGTVTGTVTVTGLVNAQGSTTSGQSGPLILCATSTSAPSNTNATSNAVSCTPEGELRAQVQGTALDGAIVTGRPVRIAGKDGSGNTQDISTTTGGELNLAPTTYNSTQPTYTNGQTAAQYEIDARGDLKVAPMNTARAFGANPTAVAADAVVTAVADRQGVVRSLTGPANPVTIRANLTGANTDVALVTVSAGTKIGVTRVSFICSAATSVTVSSVVGFGSANTPTTTGVVFAQPGTSISSLSGSHEGNGGGILGVGADGEDLRYTNSVPTSGSCDLVATYFTIES